VLLDMPDQDTHRAYIRAVAAALGRHGVPVAEPTFPVEDRADWERYRQATLPLPAETVAAVYGDQPVAVLWDETNGWSLGWGGTHDEPEHERSILGPILAEPLDVVAAVRAGLVAVPKSDEPGPWRDFEEHNEAFEATLDAYTSKERAQSMSLATDHFHLPGDCQPGTITLCCRTGDRFHHVPVDRALWQRAGEEERARLLGDARRVAGDETAVVDVVDVPALGEQEGQA
jgi:hypothetical protein